MLKTMFYYIVSPSLMVYTPVTDVFIRIQANADLFSTPSTFKISQTVTAGRKCPILQYRPPLHIEAKCEKLSFVKQGNIRITHRKREIKELGHL